MPRKHSIARAPRRQVIVCAGAPLSEEAQKRLIELMSLGLERYLACAQDPQPPTQTAERAGSSDRLAKVTRD